MEPKEEKRVKARIYLRPVEWCRTRYDKLNGGKLIVGGVLAIGLMWAALIYRAHVNSESDAKLCKKVDAVTTGLIEFAQEGPQPQPGTPDAMQLDRFYAKMRQAACDPDNLPSAK